MNKTKFYNSIINNGIGVNLQNFDRNILKKEICQELERQGFTCINRQDKIVLSKDKIKITDIILDRYGVYFSSGIISEMTKPIKILSLYLAKNTFN